VRDEHVILRCSRSLRATGATHCPPDPPRACSAKSACSPSSARPRR